MKKIMVGGIMRRIHKRVLGPSDTGISSTTSDIWLLGVCYKISQEEFSRDATTSNELVAFTMLLFHHFGRYWRKPLHEPLDHQYIEILHLFGDSEVSTFSINNLLTGSWIVYIPSLQVTFTFPQSLGIMGGKPRSSTYVASVQDDIAFYLNPYDVQSVEASSYHCTNH
ncbi:hypothetical protein P3X46_002644, partial [Hevea brasiliensis]